ncbi:thioesterase family protein [Micrococcoides hystricis]|uniref:Thioesterase family protein n=1 Tax=Micrococcoides hystricis TaxID=1572761 RepID=A0ABV6P8H4_9MICC
MSAQPTSYYRRTGEHTFVPTEHASGAWRDTEQHMAPASGILVHELLRHEPRQDVRFCRFSFEILGTIHFDEFEVKVQTIRPGRTIELVQADLIVQERTAIRLYAWRLVTADSTPVAIIHDEPMTPRADCATDDELHEWAGGYIASLTGLQDPAHQRRPGRNALWITNELDMVEGEPTHPMTKLLGMTDTANGVAPAMDPNASGYIFPNIDLQVHLYREPVGSWLGLDTTVNVGPDGIGLTSAVLNDEDGVFGRTEQILTIRKVR